jgi:hypothetical protein
MKSKYKSYAEWRDKNAVAYQYACKNGLLDTICEKFGWERNPYNRKPFGYWTKERCLEEAKKHKTKVSWRIDSGGSYVAARNNGWYDECIAHMVDVEKQPRKPSGYWDKKNCIIEAKKYNTTYEWYKFSPHTLRTSVKNGWFSACTKHMVDRRKPFKAGFTKSQCLKAASEYSSKKSWKKHYAITYYTAVEHGWIKYICEKLWNQNLKL